MIGSTGIVLSTLFSVSIALVSANALPQTATTGSIQGTVADAKGAVAPAIKVIKELEEMSGASLNEAHWIAKIYAALNEKEMAFSWLERGLATGAIGAFYKDEPVWDAIRSDPQFAYLVRRMDITP